MDEDLITSRLEALIEKVRRFCTVDMRSNVRVADEVTGAKMKIQLALAARAVASRLHKDINEDVSVVELAEATGVGEGRGQRPMRRVVEGSGD